MTEEWSSLEALARDPELDEEELAGRLATLVRTRSVNPGIYEAEMAKVVSDMLKDTGCEIRFVESLPDRPSVAAVLEGSRGTPRLVLNGHTDTVPVDDVSRWSVDPFGGEIKDGHLWGRGAADMKAGLTCQIAAARVLARHRSRLRGTLVLHFAVGEEAGEPGTLSLIREGFTGDWGIVTEPTSLAVATAQRGVLWVRIRILGRSAHASSPHAGVNPIPPLGALLDAINRYAAELRSPTHPLLGTGLCTPTEVRAGVQHNMLPDSCELVVDRRLVPGETVDGAIADIRRLATAAVEGEGVSVEVEPFPYSFHPVEVPADGAFVRAVRAVVEEVTGEPARIWGTPYGSDVRHLVLDAGMESITFGPGNIQLCHAPDERVPLRELRQAALVLTKVAADLLS